MIHSSVGSVTNSRGERHEIRSRAPPLLPGAAAGATLEAPRCARSEHRKRLGIGFLEQHLLAHCMPLLPIDPELRAVELAAALGTHADIGYIQKMLLIDGSIDIAVRSVAR
jgi:hypothetical protein